MIRPATLLDGKAILEMMRSYFKEHVEKNHYPLKWDDERAIIYLGNILWNDSGLNFISENGEGVILGAFGETWFGPNPMARPYVLYVKPEHRNGLIARALLRRFSKEAKERGAGFVLWEFETGLSDVKMIGGLMEKIGCEYQGPIYKQLFFGGN